jgi:outer membrane biosynthesis protein TonB
VVKRTLHFVSVLLLSGGLLGLTGCWFKRKPPVPQPQAQAPTTTEPQPAPPQEQPPATQPEEQQKPGDTAETQPAPKPKPKPKQNHAAKKQAPPAPKPEEKPQQEAVLKPPPKIIIQEGGADSSAGQISTTAPGQGQSGLSTAKLLEAAEANLRNLTRTLTADEQATVAQIKDYIDQSRAATKQQDLVRAHNLALKAHLLSDELVKK